MEDGGNKFLDVFLAELIFEVMEYLDPISLLSLAGACRSLYHNVYNSRGIWRRLVTRLSLESDMMPRTLPIASMTIPELRDYATRPFRIRSGILRNSLLVESERPFSLEYDPLLPTPQFLDESAPPLWWESHPRSKLLLPGGRWFLTTSHNAHVVYIFCWDLAPVLNELPGVSTRLKPVSYVAIEGRLPAIAEDRLFVLRSTLLTLSCQSNPDGKTHDVLLSIRPLEAAESLVVCHLEWSEAHPVFRQDQAIIRLAPAPFTDPTKPRFIEGDYVLIDERVSLIIWDWRYGIRRDIRLPMSPNPQNIRKRAIQPHILKNDLHLITVDASQHYSIPIDSIPISPVVYDFTPDSQDVATVALPSTPPDRTAVAHVINRRQAFELREVPACAVCRIDYAKISGLISLLGEDHVNPHSILPLQHVSWPETTPQLLPFLTQSCFPSSDMKMFWSSITDGVGNGNVLVNAYFTPEGNSGWAEVHVPRATARTRVCNPPCMSTGRLIAWDAAEERAQQPSPVYSLWQLDVRK